MNTFEIMEGIVITRFSKTLVLGGALLLMYFSCKDNGVVPPPEEDCKPVSPTDSTSHSFIWRLDTLGEGNGSVLNDVFVINDTLAYAVGEVYLKDSTGQYDPLPYNVAVWDGSKWNLRRVTVAFRGNSITPPLEGVLAFSLTDIWMVGSLPIHGDGLTWTMFDLRSSLDPNISLSKAWGISSSMMYFIGRGGSMAYYNGSSWQKLTSGTTIDMQDIWGGINCKGETEILAVASNGPSIPQGRALVKISGSTVTQVNDAGLPLSVGAVWFVPSQRYFAGGDGLFTTTSIGSGWMQEQNVPFYYTAVIRGLGLNDIVWAGGLGFVSHFNGSSWKHYTGTEIPFIQGNYYGVSIHPRLISAVGYVGQKAVALIGKR